MALRDLLSIDVHATDVEEALEQCNDHISRFDLAEEDVVSVNVLPPTPAAVLEGVQSGKPPRVRVVMVYWRYVPIG